MSEPVAVERSAESGPHRLGRRRLIVAALASALLIAAGIGLSLKRGEEFPRKNPEITTILPPLSPEKSEFSIGLDIRDKGKDIEVLEVEARTTANVEFVGAFAIWPRDLEPKMGQPGVEAGFPVGTRSRHPAFGTVVPVAELQFVPEGFRRAGDLFVQAGYRLTSGDLGGVNGLKVRYKLGGKTKSQYYPWGVVVCMKPHRCGGVGSDERRPEDRDFYKRAYVQLGLVPAEEYEN